jgi:hypothetical protein
MAAADPDEFSCPKLLVFHAMCVQSIAVGSSVFVFMWILNRKVFSNITTIANVDD